MDHSIRSATLDDLEALTDIYNYYIVNTAITFDLHPITGAERRRWFNDHTNSGPHRLLVATDVRGDCVGYATSSRWRPKPAYNTTVESSVYCRLDAVGRGLWDGALQGGLRCARARGRPHRRSWRQPAEPRVVVIPREVRISPCRRVPRGRPEVRQVLGRRLVRAAPSAQWPGHNVGWLSDPELPTEPEWPAAFYWSL